MSTPEKEVDILLKCTTKEFIHLVYGQEYKAIAEKQVTTWEWKREKVYTRNTK